MSGEVDDLNGCSGCLAIVAVPLIAYAVVKVAWDEAFAKGTPVVERALAIGLLAFVVLAILGVIALFFAPSEND